MKALLLGVFFLTSPLRAQPGGNCAVADCPDNFMPNPGPPTTAARQKVVAALASVTTAATNENRAAKQLKERFDEVSATLVKPYKRLPQWMIDRIVTAEKVQSAALADSEYLSLMVKHQTAIAETYRSHNESIREAMTAYQLSPPVTDFTGDSRAAEFNMVAKPWLPHYSRHEKRDDDTGQWRKRDSGELAKEQSDNAIVGGGVMAARTRGNGVMEFYGQAFTSPEDLAVNIFHETSHWVDIAGKSGGFNYGSDLPQVSFRTEQHAYERAAAFALQIGANAQKQLVLAKQFELQAKESEEKHLTWPQVLLKRDWIGRDRGMMAMAPAESEISPGDEELLRQKMDEAQERTNARAREQLEIAHRDHDERLKNTYLDLANRSCSNPGSVTQAELDSLPKPHNMDAMAEPPGLTECLSSVYRGLLNGANAEDLERYSTPKRAADLFPPRQVVPDASVPPTPFENVLPELSAFAAEACRAPETVSIVDFQARNGREHFYYDYSYMGRDADIAAGLSSRFDECSKALFRRLIDMHRGRQYQEILSIDRQWIRSFVAANSSVPGSSPGYTPPSGGGRVPRCEDFGNRRCPR